MLIYNSDVNFRYGVKFYWRHMLKIPKNAIFRKSAEKVLKKWGGGPIFTDYFESYAKMKICTKFPKSKTPLKLPIKHLNFLLLGMHFCWCLFCILNIFEKKIYVNSDVNFRSDVNLFWRHMLKNSQNAIFGKSTKNTSKNGVDAQIWQIISKVMPKWKFWVVDVNFFI